MPYELNRRIKVSFVTGACVAVLVAAWNFADVEAGSKRTLPELKPEQVAELSGHGDHVNSVLFHPAGDLLVSAGHDAQVISWNFAAIRSNRRVGVPSAAWEVRRKKISDHVVSIDFDRTGQWFAASGVTRWGNGFGSSLQVFTPFGDEPFKFGADAAWSYTSIALHPDGKFIAMGSLRNELKVESLAPKKGPRGRISPVRLSKSANDIPDAVLRIAVHPQEMIVAAGGKGGWVRIYLLTEEGLQRITTAEIPDLNADNVTGLQFSPDGKNLIAAGSDGVVTVFDLKNGKHKSWSVVTKAIHWLAVHPHYPWVLLACDDNIARIFDIDTGRVVAEMAKHTQPVLCAAFHPDGSYAATGGADHTIRVWKLGIKANKRKR